VQLQSSPSESLELTAVFDKTLAFHVWQPGWHATRILTGSRAGSATDTLDIAPLWTAAADLLADDHCWTVLQLNSQTTLSRYVALDPAEKVPHHYEITDEDLALPDWLAMLLMVATVLNVLLNICAVPSQPSLDTCTELAATELLGKIHQISLRQTGTQAVTKQLPSAQLKALRTSLLLLKPACLLTSAQTQVSSLCIWSAATSSCIQASQHGRDTSSGQRAAEAAEVLSLTMHLVQLTVSALKRLIAVKTSAVNAAVTCCCQLLMCLMPEGQPTLHKAAATELIQSGTDHAHFTRPTVHCAACSTPDQIAL